MTRPRITEAMFADQVEHLLDLFGWTWTHFEPAVRQSGRWATPLRGDRGFPDYVAVRFDRLLFAEIKGTGGRLSGHQAAWLHELGNAGAEVHVWYPEDLETVKGVLR